MVWDKRYLKTGLRELLFPLGKGLTVILPGKIWVGTFGKKRLGKV